MPSSWAVPRLPSVHSFPECVPDIQESILLECPLLKHLGPRRGEKGFNKRGTGVTHVDDMLVKDRGNMPKGKQRATFCSVPRLGSEKLSEEAFNKG